MALSAPVAQLDRASGYGPEGCRFKSYQVHHFIFLAHLPENQHVTTFFLLHFRIFFVGDPFPSFPQFFKCNAGLKVY